MGRLLSLFHQKKVSLFDFFRSPNFHTVFTGMGLKALIESIDNRADFKTYMQNYAYARGGGVPRGPRREGPAEEGFVSGSSSVHLRCHLILVSVSSHPYRHWVEAMLLRSIHLWRIMGHIRR